MYPENVGANYKLRLVNVGFSSRPEITTEIYCEQRYGYGTVV